MVAKDNGRGVKLAIGLVGPGLIGGTLLDQLEKQAPVLLANRGIDLQVVAVAGSRKMLLADRVALAGWRDAYDGKAQPGDLSDLSAHLTRAAAASGAAPVVVDCSAAEAPGERYGSWLGSGVHVVTPNKKVNSGPLARWRGVHAAAAAGGAHYLSEGTVGAGLPIISTLTTLLDTGDELLKVEGVLSGTLSYIFNCFGPGRPFSSVVAEAKAAGYTEPDPRDDLNGTDVARKVLTLARVAGAELELEGVGVESLVPGPLQGVASAEEYMARLPEFDAEMEARAAEADAAGQVLRYVGTYDAAAGTCSASLRRFPKDHPFAQLAGSDNMVVFTTQRYNSQPLIVRGPGAGAEVTAAGVFGDVVALAARLGA